MQEDPFGSWVHSLGDSAVGRSDQAPKIPKPSIFEAPKIPKTQSAHANFKMEPSNPSAPEALRPFPTAWLRQQVLHEVLAGKWPHQRNCSGLDSSQQTCRVLGLSLDAMHLSLQTSMQPLCPKPSNITKPRFILYKPIQELPTSKSLLL